jgi:RHS repeat-associated protein
MKVFRTQTEGAEPSVHTHYLYDAAGQRVKKLVRKQGGQVEVTHYVDGVLEHHRWGGQSQAGQNNHVHVMDDKQRIALVRLGPAHPDDRGPAVQFHLGDHLGNSNVVVDANGALTNREEFTPYGETSFGSFARKRYRFNGVERDEESGLNYHGARYYSAWLCRWTSSDPAGAIDGCNLYRYCQNNPLLLVDPRGTDPTDSDKGPTCDGTEDAEFQDNITCEASVDDIDYTINSLTPVNTSGGQSSNGISVRPGETYIAALTREMADPFSDLNVGTEVGASIQQELDKLTPDGEFTPKTFGVCDEPYQDGCPPLSFSEAALRGLNDGLVATAGNPRMPKLEVPEIALAGKPNGGPARISVNRKTGVGLVNFIDPAGSDPEGHNVTAFNIGAKNLPRGTLIGMAHGDSNLNGKLAPGITVKRFLLGMDRAAQEMKARGIPVRFCVGLVCGGGQGNLLHNINTYFSPELGTGGFTGAMTTRMREDPAHGPSEMIYLPPNP